MDILQVALFGTVRVTHNNWLTEVMLTKEIQALLAYLLLEGHRVHSREAIAAVFWGDRSQSRARGSLNTALWKLKKALEPAETLPGTYLTNSQQGGVSFNRASPYWLDTEAFESAIKRALACSFQTVSESCLQNLERSLDLYTGDLLEGFYMDWMLRERERMRALYLKSLTYLLRYYRFHGAYEKAVGYGQRILDLEPLHEEIHCDLMKLHLEHGQRVLAVRQYEICRALLDKELGILPMEETQALFRQISRPARRSRPEPVLPEQMNFEQVVRQLKDARRTIELAREKIEQASQWIARYVQQE